MTKPRFQWCHSVLCTRTFYWGKWGHVEIQKENYNSTVGWYLNACISGNRELFFYYSYKKIIQFVALPVCQLLWLRTGIHRKYVEICVCRKTNKKLSIEKQSLKFVRHKNFKRNPSPFTPLFSGIRTFLPILMKEQWFQCNVVSAVIKAPPPPPKHTH